MIQFGRLTNPRENIIKEIEKTRKLGFDYVEVGIEVPTDAAILRKNKVGIIRSLKDFQNPPVGHTAWWYDLSSLYETVRQGWLKQGKTDITIAHELGIKLLNFHFELVSNFLFQHEKSRKAILDNYVKSFNELSQFAENKGIILMLENGKEKFEHYKYVLDKVPKVKVHLDMGHAFVSGGMPTIRKFISYFSSRIAHLHIHDNHGKQDEHLALGKGKIQWIEVISLLKKAKYDKTITFEVFKSDKDLIRSREYFRNLWVKP